jgi:hypothetical protein
MDAPASRCDRVGAMQAGTDLVYEPSKCYRQRRPARRANSVLGRATLPAPVRLHGPRWMAGCITPTKEKNHKEKERAYVIPAAPPRQRTAKRYNPLQFIHILRAAKIGSPRGELVNELKSRSTERHQYVSDPGMISTSGGSRRPKSIHSHPRSITLKAYSRDARWNVFKFNFHHRFAVFSPQEDV